MQVKPELFIILNNTPNNIASLRLKNNWSMLPFYNPENTRKPSGFLVFAEGIKWEHWLEMG